jgi:hypothetical protein
MAQAHASSDIGKARHKAIRDQSPPGSQDVFAIVEIRRRAQGLFDFTLPRK